jgi:hypothetical protein
MDFTSFLACAYLINYFKFVHHIPLSVADNLLQIVRQ